MTEYYMMFFKKLTGGEYAQLKQKNAAACAPRELILTANQNN